MPAISTPCTKLCLLDPATNLCEGCGRTAAEITAWGRMSEAERLAIMAGLGERLASALPPRRAGTRPQARPGER